MSFLQSSTGESRCSNLCKQTLPPEILNHRVLKGSETGEFDPRDEIGRVKENLERKIDENRELMKSIGLLQNEIKTAQARGGSRRDLSQVDVSNYQTVDPEMRESVGPFPEPVELGEAVVGRGDEVLLLEKKLEQVRDHNSDLKKLLEAKSSELEKIELSHKRLRQEMDQIDKLRKEGDESTLKMDEKVSGLRKILDQRNDQIEELEGDLRALKKKEIAAEVKLRQFEGQVRLLKVNVESEQAQKLTLENEIDEMKDKIKVLGGSAD